MILTNALELAEKLETVSDWVSCKEAAETIKVLVNKLYDKNREFSDLEKKFNDTIATSKAYIAYIDYLKTELKEPNHGNRTTESN